MDEMKIKGIIIFILLVAWVIYSAICFISVRNKCDRFMRLVINKDVYKSGEVLYDLITDIVIFIILTGIVVGIVWYLIIYKGL